MSWHFCYFTFMPGYWFGQAILQNRVSEVGRWSNFKFPFVMFFPTKTFQESDKFPSQSSIHSLSAPNSPWRGSFAAFWQLQNQLSRRLWRNPVVLWPSHSPRMYGSPWQCHTDLAQAGDYLLSTFPIQTPFALGIQPAPSSMWKAPSLPLQVHTWSLAAASLNLGGWLLACPVTANRLWSGQACKLLCHPWAAPSTRSDSHLRSLVLEYLQACPSSPLP